LTARPTRRAARVYETVLYASDLVATAAFYSDTLGLRSLGEHDEVAVFRLDDGGILLLFDPARSSAPGRAVAHGTSGVGHVAFAVSPGELDPIRADLSRSGVEIEREITWDHGGRSIYFRDPAGNSVELIEGEAWPP
jgi:catechol 2,3-dioxygenase-like lactoylglutathione lyase family enzyme